jgi:methionine-rich copper-binding protein CopC
MPSRSCAHATWKKSLPRASTWSTYSSRVGHWRDQSAQPSLPLHERPLSQVFAVHCEQIERVEVRPLATEQQALEVAAAARIQADDLSVDHRVVRSDGVREFLTELRPVLEGVAVARHEVTVVSVDVGERSEAVVLHLEEPVRMVERLREAQERRGPECRSRL